jgi:hypothetical protein
MRKAVVASLLKYLDTDTVWCALCLFFARWYRANHPPHTPASTRNSRRSLSRFKTLTGSRCSTGSAQRSTSKSKSTRVSSIRSSLTPPSSSSARSLPTTISSNWPVSLVANRLACEDMLTRPFARGSAFERAVLASKSYLIALALVEGHYSVDEAAKAAHVEVQSQIDRWGEVEDSEWFGSFLMISTMLIVSFAHVQQPTMWTIRTCG